MKNKEVIIDDVNVAECGFYHPEYNNNACHIALAFSDQYGECWKCEQNPNCDYKMYKRKEQECETLKDYINFREGLGDDCDFCKHNNKSECYAQANIEFAKENTRYKQALEKIMEIIKTLANRVPLFEMKQIEKDIIKIVTIIGEVLKNE